jgi:hypothetical protein
MVGRRWWMPRCGAMTRKGRPCLAVPVLNEDGRPRNGRCKQHAGHSTGPRTIEGKARCSAGRVALYNRRRAAGLPCINRRPKVSRTVTPGPTAADRRASAIGAIREKWPSWTPD